MAKAVDDKENSVPQRITDANEVDCASVSPNNDLGTSDILDHGGLDAVLNLTAGVPQELKVGASKKLNRKYVVFEALDTNIKWGFTNTTQSFDAFKNQLIMMPVGEGTEVWFNVTSGTGDVAIGEIS